MKKLSIITTLLLVVFYFDVNAQHTRYPSATTMLNYTPATGDTIVATVGNMAINDSIQHIEVPINSLVIVLPTKAKAGQRIQLIFNTAIDSILFSKGTLYKPITSVRKGQRLFLTYNADGKWY